MSFLAQYRARQGDKRSHLLLDGGVLDVPDDRHAAFLNAYANAVARGERMCVVEIKTPVFRLFVDLDFKGSSAVSGEEDLKRRICQTCYDVAVACFEIDRVEMVVLEATGGSASRGVHLVFPDIFVTVDTAKAYRHAVSAEVPASEGVDLAKVFDACVYSGSGLRMPWSCKKDASSGWYVPTRVQTAGAQEGITIGTSSEFRSWLRKTCIRAPGAAETPVKNCEKFHAVQATHPASAASSTWRRGLPDDKLLAPKLLANLPACFAGTGITGHSRLSDDVLVLRSDSGYCGNLGWRAHKTNTVYLVVNKGRKSVHQRCYCRCETTEHRLFGMCKDYASPEFPVANDVLKALFDGESDDTAASNVSARIFENTRPVLRKKGKKKPFKEFLDA